MIRVAGIQVHDVRASTVFVHTESDILLRITIISVAVSSFNPEAPKRMRAACSKRRPLVVWPYGYHSPIGMSMPLNYVVLDCLVV